MATSTKAESAAKANKLQDMKLKIHEFLHEENAFTYPFALAEKYTKVKREYLFIGKGCQL